MVKLFSRGSLVQILGPNNELLAEVDPVQKTLSDSVNRIPDQCFIGSASDDKQTLLNDLLEINTLLDGKNIVGAVSMLQGTQIFAENALIDDCVTESPLDTTKEGLLSLIDDSIERLNVRDVEIPSILGDLDGDGRITGLDARKIVLLCTRPRCATE